MATLHGQSSNNIIIIILVYSQVFVTQIVNCKCQELPPITNNKANKTNNHAEPPPPPVPANNANNTNAIDKKNISAPIAVT